MIPELNIPELLREHLGITPGRLRLPGTPVAYTEESSAEDVSPETAMTWIAATWERYQSGRNFYPTKLEKIKRYADAMRNGEWEYRPEGDPITLTDGIITGGRHRLHAVLLSGQTIRANISRKTTKVE